MSLKGQYRHIGLRHERHLIRGTAPALAPGEARFSSYYLPSLPAGQYSMKIDQTITTPTHDPIKKADPAERKVEVLAPEWALSAASNGDSETTNASEEEAAVVLSVFPASGQVAPSFRTLPHMVLRDAQLPWIRMVSKDTTDQLNVIPWFALIVFSPEELELEAAERTAYFSGANGVHGTVNDTLGWDTTVDKIKDISADKLANFIPKPLTPDVRAKTATSLLAVDANTFKKLFPPKTDPATKEMTFDVSQYRFMSHIRTVPTEGTLSAGIVTDMDHDPDLAGTQTLSVVVSHRLGPTDVKVPTPVLAHLVSLQGIDGKDVNVLNGKDHVLMTSLFSWSYTALPPDAPDVVSMLQYLGTEGKGLAVLRTDMGNDPETKYASKEEEIVTKRQKDGYNLVRHRVITGEQTAAMYRGPLTPTRVPYPLNGKVSFQSNFGTDLQILDPDVGLMDISYASAWQLGKTLAMADPTFTAALSRLRMLVHRDALNKARTKVVETLRGPLDATEERGSPGKSKLSIFSDQNPHVTYMSKEEIKSDMVGILKALNGMNDKIHESGSAFSTNRWRRREPQPLPPYSGMYSGTAGNGEQRQDDLMSLRSPHIYHQMFDHALSHTFDHANADDDKNPYNYHTIPSNTDYAIIQEWILNKLHLHSIPAHYFLPDPTYVPVETLRFFHIDSNWMDALVDGALSLANHLASKPEEDYCRSALKAALNRYFKKPIQGDYCQQIPSYGFILRSKLLVQFPDLAVSAKFSKDSVHSNEDWDKVKPKAPILVQRRLGPDMMLVLMDREPPNLTDVTFTLPAHQQTFIAAFSLNKDKVGIQRKRIYATGADAPLPEPSREERRKPLDLDDPPPLDTSQLFDWDARTLKVKEYATNVHEELKAKMGNDYQEMGPTSAVFSLQLNEPIYTLSVTAERPPKPPPKASAEDLESWTILHEPSLFRFHPPAFPTERYQPMKPLDSVFTDTKIQEFTATRLNFVEKPSIELKTLQALNPATNEAADGFALVHHQPASRISKTNTDSKIPRSLSKPMFPKAQPEYNFGIFPIGRQKDNYIPCNNDRPIDLVFSIVRDELTTPEAYSLRIKEWKVIIMIQTPGRPPTENDPPPRDYTTPRALLRKDMRDGAPPVMLSNLRYNVMVKKWDMKGDLLYLSIVPRSSWGVHLRDTPDVSFLLPMANVYPWDIPEDGEYAVGVELWSKMVDADDPNGEEREFFHRANIKMRTKPVDAFI